MRLFLEQLKKFKVTNDLSKYIYLLNNTVLYTDGQIYIKKHVGYNFGGNYEVNTKNLLDLVKGLKSITDVKIENDLLIINNQYKIKVSETGMGMPVVLSDDNLLNKKIMSGVNVKDIKEFAKVGAGQGIYSILKNICIKENEIAVTDGNRLNILNIETFKGNESYLLPAELITKNISKSVDIFVNDNYISVVGDYGIMTQQKDCGQYPKYNQLIPQKDETRKIKLDKKFFEVLKNMKSCINNSKVVVFDFMNNKIKSYNEDILHEFDYNFDFYYGVNTKLSYIAFNYDFLMDLYKFIDNDFTLYLGNSNLSACLIKEENKLTLLMPVQCRQPELYNLNEPEQEEPQKEPEQITTPEPEPEQKEEFEKQVEKLPDDVKKVMDDVKEKMMKNKEYKNIIKKEPEAINEPEKMTEPHINAVTGHVYSGHNIEVLNNAGFTSHEWVGGYQAKKLHKQVKKDAEGVTIRVYYEDDMGRSFCKLETVYNIEQLEPLQKVGITEAFKNIVEKLKKAV